MNRISNFTFLIILSLFLASCDDDKGKNIPDVSDIEVSVNMHRFEQDLFSIDTQAVASNLAALENKYPAFSNIYFNNVIGIKKELLGQEKYEETVRGFLTFEPVRKLYDTCMLVYSNLDWLKNDLHKAFQFYKYYFPEQSIPEVYTFISEYTYGSFMADGEKGSILAIGIDFFLGADYLYYDPNYFPNYIKRTMTREHMPVRAMQALVDDLAGPVPEGRMLDMMLHNGKKLYILDQFLPYAADSLKLGYTNAQVKWVAENEAQMWGYFVEKQLLYSTKFQDFRKLVEYSPNSPGMPPEAPGRTANWIGWQIVKSYMARHPDTTLTELIELRDAQQLLEQSKYKPKRG